MFTNSKEMLQKAYREHYMVIAAECWSLNSAAAHIDTAAKLGMPLIIMLFENPGETLASYRRIAEFVRREASLVDIPVALHLDHARELDSIKAALDAGFSSVMLDASAESFEENVRRSAKAVEIAKAYGASTEAELGHVGGNGVEGVTEGLLTDPKDVVEFVKLTNVDSLAVSVGTSHGVYKCTPHLDFDRMKAISEVSPVPLVLHGGSGTGFDLLSKASQYGISKLNVMTDFVQAAMKNLNAEGYWFPDDAMYAGMSACLKEYLTKLSKKVC